MLVRLFSLLTGTTAEVVIVREDKVGGVETHRMNIFKPPTSSVAISLPSVYTAQDINDTQSIISQVEGVTSIWACCLNLRRSFCSVTGPGGSDIITTWL